jgi:hypothetical protein
MTFFSLFLDILFCPQNCALDFLFSSLDLSTQNRARSTLISIITETQKSLDFTNQDFFFYEASQNFHEASQNFHEASRNLKKVKPFFEQANGHKKSVVRTMSHHTIIITFRYKK